MAEETATPDGPRVVGAVEDPLRLDAGCFTDDAAVLAAAMKVALSAIQPEHREAARRKLGG